MAQALSLADIANWDAAVLLYQQRLAQEVAYDVAHWRPAYRTSNDGGPSIPADVNAAMERLQDARREAEDGMVALPAPSLEDVSYKIGILRETWEGFEWSDEVWAPIEADLDRLAAEPKKVAALLGNKTSERPESNIAKHIRFLRSRDWRAAVEALNTENNSGETTDEAFDRAGAAFSHAMGCRVTTLDEFREKLELLDSNLGVNCAYLDELFRDLEALGARARRKVAA